MVKKIKESRIFMRFLYKIRKIKNKFQKKFSKNFITLTSSEIIGLINEFPEPKNDIQRSYFQYKCRKKYESIFARFFEYLFFLVLTPLLYLVIVIQSKPIRKVKRDMVYFKISDNSGIFPEKLLGKDYKIVPIGKGFSNDFISKNIIKEAALISHFNPAFLFKIIFNLSNYCYIRKKYSPKKILTSYESSYTSSILTYYCNRNGIKHINIMHGEKLISPSLAFFRFNEFYIWDEYYKNIFLKHRCKIDEFYIYNPFKRRENISGFEQIDFCFYLPSEPKVTLIKLKDLVEDLIDKGYKVKIRPHPSQIDDNLINIFKENLIEKDIDINESIIRTHNIVSRYSTVLFQAFSIGKSVIVDDVTNPKEFKALKDLQFIIFEKKHKLLSEVLKEI